MKFSSNYDKWKSVDAKFGEYEGRIKNLREKPSYWTFICRKGFLFVGSVAAMLC